MYDPRKLPAALLPTIVCALFLALAPSEADAKQIPKSMRSSTHPRSLLVGIGQLWRLHASDGSFRMSQQLMFHLGRAAKGPALGLSTDEEFNSHGLFALRVAGRFEYDIQVVRGLAFYVTPGGSFGYRLERWDRGRDRFETYHQFSHIFDMTGKLVFVDRWMVWARFPAFEFIAAPDWFAVRLGMLAGGGVTF